ncbi:MAG: hypothetical protein K1563_20970 [Candidatus Thiodiazotropha sp. (ex. Lucinisca nassula)]|nr:hypothetical protein [Candidatus Thiodiazotropha sp. (ex. Lucinisca nassula)]MBW9276155.1 hypothetical protein [Candidatus Thiodiazotropha sp. (ex. Lucinisca nassula)]
MASTISFPGRFPINPLLRPTTVRVGGLDDATINDLFSGIQQLLQFRCRVMGRDVPVSMPRQGFRISSGTPVPLN